MDCKTSRKENTGSWSGEGAPHPVLAPKFVKKSAIKALSDRHVGTAFGSAISPACVGLDVPGRGVRVWGAPGYMCGEAYLCGEEYFCLRSAIKTKFWSLKATRVMSVEKNPCSVPNREFSHHKRQLFEQAGETPGQSSKTFTAAKPVRNTSRCSLMKLQAMSYNSPQSRGTERKEFQRQGGSPN